MHDKVLYKIMSWVLMFFPKPIVRSKKLSFFIFFGTVIVLSLTTSFEKEKKKNYGDQRDLYPIYQQKISLHFFFTIFFFFFFFLFSKLMLSYSSSHSIANCSCDCGLVRIHTSCYNWRVLIP